MTSVPPDAVSRHLGYVEIVTVDVAADPAAGRPYALGRGGAELVVVLQSRQSGTILLGDWEAPLAAGDFAVFEASRPFRVRSHGQVVCFVVPRLALGLGSRDLQRLTRTTVRGDQGLGALVSLFLTELAAGAAHWEPELGERLAGKTMDLLACLIAERAAGDIEADARLALLNRVKSFIAANIAAPDLTLESIAGAHHISLRYLHKLFQDEELTVGRFIQRCRLEKCREELCRGRGSGPGVAVIAQRWGFTHPSRFARAFRAAYGMSPGEWQAAAEHAETAE